MAFEYMASLINYYIVAISNLVASSIAITSSQA